MKTLYPILIICLQSLSLFAGEKSAEIDLSFFRPKLSTNEVINLFEGRSDDICRSVVKRLNPDTHYYLGKTLESDGILQHVSTAYAVSYYTDGCLGDNFWHIIVLRFKDGNSVLINSEKNDSKFIYRKHDFNALLDFMDLKVDSFMKEEPHNRKIVCTGDEYEIAYGRFDRFKNGKLESKYFTQIDSIMPVMRTFREHADTYKRFLEESKLKTEPVN